MQIEILKLKVQDACTLLHSLNARCSHFCLVPFDISGLVLQKVYMMYFRMSFNKVINPA